MKFGDRLKELRTESGLTQEELANQLNLSKANVSKYESNSIEPNLDMLSLLSSLFEVSTDYLLGKSDLRNPLEIPEHIEGIANLVLRMRSDDEFSDIINKINELSPEQLKAISTILSSMN